MPVIPKDEIQFDETEASASSPGGQIFKPDQIRFDDEPGQGKGLSVAGAPRPGIGLKPAHQPLSEPDLKAAQEVTGQRDPSAVFGGDYNVSGAAKEAGYQALEMGPAALKLPNVIGRTVERFAGLSEEEVNAPAPIGDVLERTGQRGLKVLREKSDADLNIRDYRESVSRGTESFPTKVLGNIGPTAAGVTTSLIPVVGPPLSLTLFMGMNAEDAYQTAIEKGATPENAEKVAVTAGTIMSLLDQTGISVITKKIPGAANFVKKMVDLSESALVEGGTEVVQDVVAKIGGEWAAKDPKESAAQFADRMSKQLPALFEGSLETFKIAAATGGLFRGAGHGINVLSEQRRIPPTGGSKEPEKAVSPAAGIPTAPQAESPTFTPTHILPDGTVAQKIEEGVVVDREGNIYAEEDATPTPGQRRPPDTSFRARDLSEIPGETPIGRGLPVEPAVTAEKPVEAPTDIDLTVPTDQPIPLPGRGLSLAPLEEMAPSVEADLTTGQAITQPEAVRPTPIETPQVVPDAPTGPVSPEIERPRPQQTIPSIRQESLPLPEMEKEDIPPPKEMEEKSPFGLKGTDKNTSLAGFVRAAGGINETQMAGDVRQRFSIREGFNLINRKTGLPLDRLRQMAAQHGFVPEDSTPADFLEALRRDADSLKALGKGSVFSRYYSPDLPGFDSPEAKALERRIDIKKRKRIDLMSEEEKNAEIENLRAEIERKEKAERTNPVSGIPNRLAYNEALSERPRIQTMIDLDGLKWINEKLLHEGGDAFIKALGRAIESVGLEGYHLSGDEFAVLSDREVDAYAGMEQLRDVFKNAIVTVRYADGSARQFKGLDFSYGVGPDRTTADGELYKDKTRREASGERAVYPQPPPSLVEVTPPESGADRDRDPGPEDRGGPETETEDFRLTSPEAPPEEQPKAPTAQQGEMFSGSETMQTGTRPIIAEEAKDFFKPLEPEVEQPSLLDQKNTAEPQEKNLHKMTKEELIARYNPGNPFAQRAANARFAYERITGPTAEEKAMEQSFPLGVGYGRKGAEKKLERRIDRAVKAVELKKEAEYREAQAESFDAGRINAQGRRMNSAAWERSEKREVYKSKREERIANAKKVREGKESYQVPANIWADSSGYFGGSARALILSEHREAVEKAISEGKNVPPEVLKEYPDLQTNQKLEEARQQVEINPSEAQIEAGNYQKGHIRIHGLDISIENPKGSVRKVGDKEYPMNFDYGYIKGTTGADKEHIDVYLGPNLESEKVFVVNQVDPEKNKFDEQKIMLGFSSPEEAKTAYLKQYDNPAFFGSMVEVSMEDFKARINGGGKLIEPAEVIKLRKRLFDEGEKKKQAENRERLKAVMKRDAPSAEATPEKKEPSKKKPETLNKLRALAERMKENANETLGRDTKRNTAKRAREAAYTDEEARKEIALAETMENLANAIESGEIKHLSGLSSKIQLEELNSIANLAKYAAIRARNNGSLPEREVEKPMTEEDVRFAKYPTVWLSDYMKEDFAKDMDKYRGGKSLAARLRAARGGVIDFDLGESVLEMYKKHGETRLGWQIKNSLAAIKRMRSMGITNTDELHSALREFVRYRGKKAKEDPIKVLERELVGNKIPGYFNTAESVVDRMIEEAGIEKGMKVLEPSAGKGSIADKVKEAAGAVDTVEINSTLRKLLEAKGHTVVAQDFMDFEGKDYDRIVMNPPFENGQDIDHVRRAYDKLKPGGRVVAIMSEGVFFRGDKKATEFREWLDDKGTSEKLPEGSFKTADRPTGVNARMVIIDKPKTKSLSEMVDEALAGRPPLSEADKLRKQADAIAKEAMVMMEGIEPGQPVLSASDRNRREKSAEKMRKASELNAQADALEKGEPVQFSVARGAVRLTNDQYRNIVADLQRIIAPGSRVVLKGQITANAEGNEKALASWGMGDTTGEIRLAGLHRTVRLNNGQLASLIQLSLRDMNEGTPYHEAWHSVESLLLSDKEIETLRAAFPDKDGVVSTERTADAFADWVAKKKIEAPGRVRLLFMKIRTFFEKLRNALRGRGFNSVEDLFGKAFAGELRGRATRGQVGEESFSVKKYKTPEEAKQATLEARKVKEEARNLKIKLRAAEKASREGFRAGVSEERLKADAKIAEMKRDRTAIISRLKNTFAEKLEEIGRAQELKDLKADILSRNVESIKKEIADYAKKHLPMEARGAMLSNVAKAQTHADLVRAFARVDKIAEEVERKSVISEFKDVLQRISESNTIAVAYRNRIRDLLSNLEFSEGRYRRAKALLMDGGMDPETEAMMEAMSILARKPLSELSTDEIRGMLNEIVLLEELGKQAEITRKELWEARKEAIKERLVAGTSPIEKPEGRAIAAAQHIDLAITPMDAVIDRLDGGKGSYDGVNHSLIKKPIDSAWGKFLDAIDPIKKSAWEMAGRLQLTNEDFERIGIYAAAQQEGGREKLLNNGLTEEEIDAIQLRPSEMEFYQWMRKELDLLWPRIAKIMADVYGKPFGKVKNYFSFMTDWEKLTEMEVVSRLIEAPEYAPRTKNPNMQFTKSRVGPGGQKIKLNAMEIFLRHTENAEYLINMGPTVKMLYEVANSKEYGAAAGDKGQSMIVQWLDLIARKGGIQGDRQIAILDILRRNVGVATMAFKLSSALVQPSSLVTGASLIGRYAFTGSMDVATSKRWREFLTKNFPEIRDREADDPAFMELSDRKWLARITKIGLGPLKKLDLYAASAITAGAYQKYLNEHGQTLDFEKPNKDAIAYAELMLRRTQASMFFKDTPLAISRGALTGNRSLDKVLFQFQNFALNNWSLIRHDLWRAGIREKNPAKAARIFTWLTLATLAEVGLRDLAGFLTGQDDDDPVEKEIAQEALNKIPFLSHLVSAIIYQDVPIPVVSTLMRIPKGIGRMLFGKEPETKARGLVTAVEGVGRVAGIPGAAQVGQSAREALSD